MVFRRFPLRTAILVLCAAAFAARLNAAAVKPDYYAARGFAVELQQDFNERNCIALFDRLDRDALRHRIFRPLGEAIEQDQETQTVWTSSILPSIENDLQRLDHMTSLAVGRVILLGDGDRAVECIFFGDKDAFQLITLRLHEAADGHIGISDLQFLGSPLDISHRIRQSLLLGGLRSHDLLPDDELALQHMVEGSDRPQINQTLYLLQQGKADEAYRTWLNVSEDLQQSAIGNDMRARLAGRGSKQAAEDMRAAWRANPATNPFAAYSLALTEQDLPRALATLDLVLQETQQLAFLRGIKAGLLLKLGRAEEALQLSQDVCELTPINGVSYMVGVAAAAELQRPQVALELIQRWHHVSTTESIDLSLKGEDRTLTKLTAFLQSSAYQDWLTEAKKADQAITKKPAD
ncbi:MAG: hypothetical protein JSS11_09305 [Verrucomicrobia bacterium]|nr:hypothetical protein [Verrucomicrobiota bacterium]